MARTRILFLWDGFNQEFAEGQVAMGFGYPWWLSGIKIVYGDDYLSNFGVTLMPMAELFGAFKYGHGYGVNRHSKHIDEVWETAEWPASRRHDITPIGHMMANLGSLPNVPSDILSVQYEADRPIYEGFIRNLDYVHNTPPGNGSTSPTRRARFIRRHHHLDGHRHGGH